MNIRHLFQAYVVLLNEMGGTWVEKNVGYILGQVVDLLSNSKATQNHVDAVYSRKCVSFILRSMLGRLLGEKAQVIAGKELCKLVSKQMTKVRRKSKLFLHYQRLFEDY